MLKPRLLSHVQKATDFLYVILFMTSDSNCCPHVAYVSTRVTKATLSLNASKSLKENWQTSVGAEPIRRDYGYSQKLETKSLWKYFDLRKTIWENSEQVSIARNSVVLSYERVQMCWIHSTGNDRNTVSFWISAEWFLEKFRHWRRSQHKYRNRA